MTDDLKDALERYVEEWPEYLADRWGGGEPRYEEVLNYGLDLIRALLAAQARLTELSAENEALRQKGPLQRAYTELKAAYTQEIAGMESRERSYTEANLALQADLDAAQSRLTELSAENEELSGLIYEQALEYQSEIGATQAERDAAQSRLTRIEEAARGVVRWREIDFGQAWWHEHPEANINDDIDILAAALDTPSTPEGAP